MPQTKGTNVGNSYGEEKKTGIAYASYPRLMDRLDSVYFAVAFGASGACGATGAMPYGA